MAEARSTRDSPHVELRDISKFYGDYAALKQVSLAIGRGSVHALVGENGAGKSTLGKIISGATKPTAGTLLVDGRELAFKSPRDALALRVARISQELSLLPERTVVENVFLGSEPTRLRLLVDRVASLRRFAELVDRSGLKVPARAQVRDLNAGDQQKVEILRALARDAQLIVMDEPTAALSRVEAEALLKTIRWLSDEGTTVVFVSHFLDDVLNVADEVTVLRDGRLIATSSAAGRAVDSLVEDMLGRPMSAMFPSRAERDADGPVKLAVSGLRARDGSPEVAFTVRAGEIVGLAGLVGSGRTELVRQIYGADPRISGSVAIDGVPIGNGSPRGAIRAGIAMLPESRKTQGLNLTHSISQNIALPGLPEFSSFGFMRTRQLDQRVAELIHAVGVQPADGRHVVGTLSGGNQQRALFAKMLVQRPQVLIVDEPTRGVDVGGKRAIYDLIAGLADQGMAVLMVSSELEEILGMADRVLAMKDGAIVAQLPRTQINEHNVLRAIFGQQGDRE